MTSRVADFLLARIAEDETAAATAQLEFAHAGYGCYGPARVLAECAAKRAIIESLTNTAAAHANEVSLGQKLVLAGMDTGLRIALQTLTLPYREHPDYDEDWTHV